jgi:O-antigen ligase
MNRWNAFLLLIFALPLPNGLVHPVFWNLSSIAVFWLLALEFRSRYVQYKVRTLPSVPFSGVFLASTPALILIWGVQLWALLQCWLFSLSPYDSSMSLSKGLMYAGLFTLTLLMVDSRSRVRQLIWVVIAMATVQAIYGSLMVLSGMEYGFFQSKEHYIGKATGTFVNRNHLAGYLEMSIALGIGLLLAEPTRYYGSTRQRLRQLIQVMLSTKLILRLLLAVLVIALVLTRSRMGNTAFFASLMIAGALALILMRNKTTATTVLLGSLLVIDIAIVGTFFGVEQVAERIQQTSSDKESRDEVTRDTINMFAEYPVVGTGVGTFTYIYPAFKGDDVSFDGTYNNAHNDYAQFAAEFGAPAFFALVALVMWSLWNGVSSMRMRNSRFYQGLGFAVTMAIVAIGIHSSVDFNLQIPANASMYVVVLALSAIARWGPHTSEHSHSINQPRKQKVKA